MSLKNITKNLFFVIFLLWICSSLAACDRADKQSRRDSPPGAYSHEHEPPILSGNFATDDIGESSGVAVSQCNSGVLWTVNDSGDGPFLYAFDEKGTHLGTFRVPNATNKDWEALAYRKDANGSCSIYVGEIGNNELERPEQAIYRLTEPVISAEDARSSKADPKETAPSEKLTFTYPDVRHNAEALLVDPSSGNIYIITKTSAGPAVVFKIPPDFGKAVTAQRIAEISLPAIPNGMVTGGEFAADGKSVVVSDYFAGYELRLPASSARIDEIWSQKPQAIDIGKRKVGEAIAYSPDGSVLFATSEGKAGSIYRINRKQK